MSGHVLHYPDGRGGEPALRAESHKDETSLDTSSDQRHDSLMIEERLARLEGIVEGFRSFPPLALTALSLVMAAVGVVLTIGIFSINGMRGEIKNLGTRMDDQIKDLGTRTGGQIKDLGTRMDGLSRQLSEEFRAMRAETAAQTSAIANSITAARQFQPQVIAAPPAPQPQQDQKPRR